MGSGSSVEHGPIYRPRTAGGPGGGRPCPEVIKVQPIEARGNPSRSQGSGPQRSRGHSLPGSSEPFSDYPPAASIPGQAGTPSGTAAFAIAPGNGDPAYPPLTYNHWIHRPVNPAETAATAALSHNPAAIPTAPPPCVHHPPETGDPALHPLSNNHIPALHDSSQSEQSLYLDQPPGIGFRSEITDRNSGSSTMDRGRPSSGRPSSGRPRSARPGSRNHHGDWGAAQDLTLMRVLSAEEFVTRMKETDDAIRYWSQHVDRDLQYAQVKENVGLRGHLQDELLRIQAMLSEEDPELRCLWDFEDEYPDVVNQLRELHSKSQSIQIQSIDIGMETVAPVPQTAGTTFPSINAQPRLTAVNSQQSSAQGHSIGTPSAVQGQSRGSQGHGLGHSIAVGDVQDEAVIDRELRPKFVAEENHVNDDFTKQFIRGGRHLSQSDMDRLLSDHAVSMQALRKKQDLEKEKYKELLQAKKQERLLTRRAANQKDVILPNTSSNKPKQKGDFFFVDFSNTPNKSKGVKKEIPKNTSGPKSTWFYVDLDQNKSKKEKEVDKHVTPPTAIVHPLPAEVRGSRSSIADAPSAASSGSKHSQGQGQINGSQNSHDTKSDEGPNGGESDDEDLEEYDDDFEEEEEDEDSDDKEDLKTTLKDDLWTTLNDNDGMSKEAFQDLLGAYRDQEDGRKALRGVEQLKHKSSFLAKLAEKQKRDKSNRSSSSSLSSGSSLSNADDPFEKELEEIKKIDGDLMKKLLSQRKNLTDAEFQELLRRHLADVERLRRQRAGERAKLDARLQEKLKMKKGKDNEDNEEEFDPADETLERELTELDNKLQDELRRRGKNIDESDLEELLDHYRRQQEALLKRQKSEKSKLDDILKQRLAEKKVSRKERDNLNMSSSSSLSSGSSLSNADDPFEKELEEIKKIDGDLMKKLLSQRKNLTDAEFQELLRRHLADVERLRRQRAGERAKLDARLQEKLKMKKGKDNEDNEEEFDPADETLERELTELDNKLQDELRRRGKNIDESDLEELLEHYRHQQEMLLKRRKSEKSKLDDILKQRLAEKKVTRKEDDPRNNDRKTSLKGVDESIFQEIQNLQVNGKLTEAAFSDLMGDYLNQVDQNSRDKKHKQLTKNRKNNTEADLNAATTLVQESQEQTKQIQGIRQREKEVMDQRLRRKLQAKKHKSSQLDS